MVVTANCATPVMFYLNDQLSGSRISSCIYESCELFSIFLFLMFTAMVVGFERRIYTVNEADGQAELCVNITMPRQQNIGSVTFDLTVETQDGSAGTYCKQCKKKDNYRVDARTYVMCVPLPPPPASPT